MLYCPPNVTLSDIWINHGTSQCFMETVSNSVIAGFLLIAGTIQLCMYRKYGTEVSPNQLTKSKMYYTQIFFTLFIPLLEVVRFSLQATVLNDKQIYGYMVSTTLLFIVGGLWLIFVFCLWLMHLSVWVSWMCQLLLLYYSCILFNGSLKRVLMNAKTVCFWFCMWKSSHSFWNILMLLIITCRKMIAQRIICNTV